MEKQQFQIWFLYQMPKGSFLMKIKEFLIQILVLQFQEVEEHKVSKTKKIQKITSLLSISSFYCEEVQSFESTLAILGTFI